MHVVGSDGIRAKVFACLLENPLSEILINLWYMHQSLSTSLIPESKLMTKLYQDKRFEDNARKILKLTCSINNATGICEWLLPKSLIFKVTYLLMLKMPGILPLEFNLLRL